MSFNLLATFGSVMTYIGYILLAILVLLIMITVHEFGHYIAGKIFGFGIEEFAIGFGPKLFKKQKKNGELFSIRLLPIGGFCAFKGEDKNDDDPSAFNNKPWWQRIIVLFAGAFMNFLLALTIIMLMFGVFGQSVIQVGKITPSTEYTEEYSLNYADIILEANGKNVYLITDLIEATDGKKAGEEIDFKVRRNGKDIDIKVKLRQDANYKNLEDVEGLCSALGIAERGEGYELYSATVRFDFFQTIARGFEYSFVIASSIFTVFRQLITGQIGLKSLGGVVTTVTSTAEAVKIGGFRYLLDISAFIGVNLAIFNLLPIPALDGSRILFTAIEGITKKPLPRKIEAIIHTVGLVLLLLFTVFVDLQRCF